MEALQFGVVMDHLRRSDIEVHAVKCGELLDVNRITSIALTGRLLHEQICLTLAVIQDLIPRSSRLL